MGNAPSASQLLDDADDQQNTLSGEEAEEVEGNVLNISMLFNPESLVTVGAKFSDTSAGNILSTNRTALISWLKQFQQRYPNEFVTESQFCSFLESEGGLTLDKCIQAFKQFDVEGQGSIDAGATKQALEKLLTGSFRSDLTAVNCYLSSCNMLPGFLDIYSDDKSDVSKQAVSILMFILKNRATSTALQVTALSGFNDLLQQRLCGLRVLTERRSNTDTITSIADANNDFATEELTAYSAIISDYDVSSNKTLASRLFTMECWESNGEVASHWIRLGIKNGVNIRELRIGVKEADMSYMPQHVVVLAGNTVDNLGKINEVNIPRSKTGFVLLLKDVNVHYSWIQIKIVRCHDGMNTKINGIKIVGYRNVPNSSPVNTQMLSVMDSMVIWYLQIMSATVSLSVPTNEQLRNTILRQSRVLFQNLPPLSLSANSCTRPSLLTANILHEINSFLSMLIVEPEGKVLMDGLSLMLQFNLACGHMSKLLDTMITLLESGLGEVDVGNLMQVISSATNTFRRTRGRTLAVELAGCDGGVKTDGLLANAVLTGVSNTTSVYLSDDGKTRVNMFFKHQDYLQISKLKLRIQKGGGGPRCGLVFVYMHSGIFDIDEHVKMFEKYDSWREKEYADFSAAKKGCRSNDEPVAYFSFDEVWDEIEVFMDIHAVGQYVLVKFLEPRQPTAERLGIGSIRFFGFTHKFHFDENSVVQANEQESAVGVVPTVVLCRRILQFLYAISVNQHKTSSNRSAMDKHSDMDLSGTSISLLWKIFNKFRDSNASACIEVLQLTHSLLPHLANSRNANKQVDIKCFKELCDIVDNTNIDEVTEKKALISLAAGLITDGAAVFFSDKDVRKRLMLDALKCSTKSERMLTSSSLQLKSLCQFYSIQDPAGLLGLPSQNLLTDSYDVSPMLSMINSVMLACQYDPETAISSGEESTVRIRYFLSLLCSLQSTLLMWCGDQTVADSKELKSIAQTVVVQYTDLLSSFVASYLKLLSSKSDDIMMKFIEQVDGNILCTLLQPFVLIINFLSERLSATSRTKILHAINDVIKQFNTLSMRLPKVIHGVESEFWVSDNVAIETLTTWDVESPHPYDNNQDSTQIFSYPGASSFIIEFDSHCVTERTYDYLEFTNSSGQKVRCDGSVGSENWPLRLTLKSGRQLQFAFHSDGSSTDWGYKFKVLAKGYVGAPLNPVCDVYLSTCKLLGRLCGGTFDMSPGSISDGATKGQILNSELWTTILRGGYATERLQRSISGKMAAEGDSHAGKFLYRLIEQEDEQSIRFLLKVRECPSIAHIGPSYRGSDIDDVIVSVFAALLWHTQSLREEIETYAKYCETDDFSQTSNNVAPISEGVVQAYIAAESLRLLLVEQKQNYILEKDSGKDGSQSSDPITIMKNKAMFLLRFAGLSKVIATSEKFARQVSKNLTRLTSVCDAEAEKKMERTFLKYPSLRLVLEFVQDTSWSCDRVEQLLKERSSKAKAIASVYSFVQAFIRDVAADRNIFQIPVVILLQEVLNYQGKIGQHYADGLDGCGLELESRVRDAYYKLLRTLVLAIRTTSRSSLPRSYWPHYDFVVAVTLHLLDMNWQMYDLPFVEQMKLAEFYQAVSIDYVAPTVVTSEARDDEKELQHYEKSKQLMDDYKSGKSAEELGKSFCSQYFLATPRANVFACDACRSSQWFSRYRCLECNDYDLCHSCFTSGIIAPDKDHTTEHQLCQLRYICTGCSCFIMGTRLHCTDCEDVDLCVGCWKNSVHPPRHKADHNMEEYDFKKFNQVLCKSSRLQPYIHQHARMLFSSLALSVTGMLHSQQLIDADYIGAATSVYKSIAELCSTLLNSVTDVQPTEDKQSTFAIHLYDQILATVCTMLSGTDQTSMSQNVCGETLLSNNLVSSLLNLLQKKLFQGDEIKRLCIFSILKLLVNFPTVNLMTDAVLIGNEDSQVHAAGVVTVQFFFNLGVSFIEKKNMTMVGYVVKLIQRLYHSSTWNAAVVQILSGYFEQIAKKKCSTMSVMASYVVAGFPDMWSIGCMASYKDSGVEPQLGVIFGVWEWKHTIGIVDKKTRKRVQFFNFQKTNVFPTNVNCLDLSTIPALLHFFEETTNRLHSGEIIDEPTVWMLSLVLKALQGPLSKGGQVFAQFLKIDFLRGLVHLASVGTNLSWRWLIPDLEVLSIKSHIEKDWRHVSSPQDSVEDGPLRGLDDEIRVQMKMLNETFGIPLPLVRAYYEEVAKKDINALVELVLEMSGNDDFKDFLPVDEPTKLHLLSVTKNWSEKKSKKNFDEDIDNGINFALECLNYADTNVLNQCREGADADDDITDSAGLIEMISEEGKRKINQKRIEKISAALLKKELEGDRDNSTDYQVKILQAMAILYARHVLLHLLSDWPTTDDTLGVKLTDICTSDKLPYLLNLIRPMGTAEIFSKAVKNMLEHWPQAELEPVVLVVCNFLKSVSTKRVTCEWTDFDEEGKRKTSGRVQIPDADFLHVKFDASCSTNDSCVELLISCTEDFSSYVKQLGGTSNHWYDIQMPGSTLFYKYSPENVEDEFFVKFHVTAGHIGLFDTGYLIVQSMLGIPSVVSTMPMNNIWRRLVHVACKQRKKFRLVTIQLLLSLLRCQTSRNESQKELDVDLTVVAPLWRLYEKVCTKRPGTSQIVASPLSRALVELFSTVEYLAMENNVADEYAFSLSSDTYVRKLLTQSLENVASVSFGISYDNIVTRSWKR